MAFLSYNLQDRALAFALNDRIAGRGVATFLAEEDLLKAGGEALHDYCYQALGNSQVMLVCVGPHGIGPSQRLEISTAFQPEAEERLQILLVLVGAGTRDHVPDDLLRLRSKVPYDFDPPRQEGRALIDWLDREREAFDARKREAPPEPANVSEAAAQQAQKVRAATAADELAKSVVKHGLTVFVGSLWPDRSDAAVFNPNRVALDLLRDVDIPVPDPDHVMSLDRAALCFTIAKGGDLARENDAQDEILKRIRMASLVGPRSHRALARLAKRFHERSRDEGRRAFEPMGAESKPFLLTTTNVDRLLERHLVAEGVPFLRLVANQKGGSHQALFERIFNLEDGTVRIETDVASPGGQQTSVTTETVAYGPAARDERPWAKPFRERLEVLKDRTPQEVWKDLQIDSAIWKHSNDPGVLRGSEGRPDPDDARRMERERTAAIEANIPILLKVFGCVDSASERALNLGTMLQFSGREGWIPRDILTCLGATASLFVGFSYADLRFIHLSQQALSELFELGADRRRVLVSPAEDGPLDGLGEVDSVLLKRLIATSGEFRKIRSVDDDPKAFIDRLLERELIMESVFV